MTSLRQWLIVLAAVGIFVGYQALELVFSLGKAIGRIEQREQPTFRFAPDGRFEIGLPPWGTQVNDATGKAKRS